MRSRRSPVSSDRIYCSIEAHSSVEGCRNGRFNGSLSAPAERYSPGNNCDARPPAPRRLRLRRRRRRRGWSFEDPLVSEPFRFVVAVVIAFRIVKISETLALSRA